MNSYTNHEAPNNYQAQRHDSISSTDGIRADGIRATTHSPQMSFAVEANSSTFWPTNESQPYSKDYTQDYTQDYTASDGYQYQSMQPPAQPLQQYNLQSNTLQNQNTMNQMMFPPNASYTLQRAPEPSTSQPRKAQTDIDTIPYTREFVEEYRERIRKDPDPDAHWQYVQYLIEAAKRICIDEAHTKSAIKYRDALIQEIHRLIKKLALDEVNPQAEAMYLLADCYSFRRLGFNTDFEKAFKLYEKGAKLEHAPSAFKAGKCKEFGTGTRRDETQAALYYQLAAKWGDTEAMFEVFKILFKGDRLKHKANPALAIQWLKTAADQADARMPAPLYQLALIYEKGIADIAPKDESKAFQLFQQAATLNFRDAQYRLGRCYENGELGCAIDPKWSIKWYSDAANQNHPLAQYILSGWYLTGSAGLLDKSYPQAYAWALKAAKNGLDKAEYAIGYYNEVGIAVKKDMEEAKSWYLRAAAQGYAPAKQRLMELKQSKGQVKNNNGCKIM